MMFAGSDEPASEGATDPVKELLPILATRFHLKGHCLGGVERPVRVSEGTSNNVRIVDIHEKVPTNVSRQLIPSLKVGPAAFLDLRSSRLFTHDATVHIQNVAEWPVTPPEGGLLVVEVSEIGQALLFPSPDFELELDALLFIHLGYEFADPLRLYFPTLGFKVLVNPLGVYFHVLAHQTFRLSGQHPCPHRIVTLSLAYLPPTPV